jgi:hypothetical protein
VERVLSDPWGALGWGAEVSVGLVEQGLAERRGALGSPGSLVVGYALKELGFTCSLELGELQRERILLDGEAFGAGLQRPGAGVDLEASDAVSAAPAADSRGERLGESVSCSEVLLVAAGAGRTDRDAVLMQ